MAAIVAEAITTQRISQAPQGKTSKDKESSSAPERLIEAVANDEGAVDLGDFQYFAFTLLTLTYFTWAFIGSPGQGLPAIPFRRCWSVSPRVHTWGPCPIRKPPAARDSARAVTTHSGVGLLALPTQRNRAGEVAIHR